MKTRQQIILIWALQAGTELHFYDPGVLISVQ